MGGNTLTDTCVAGGTLVGALGSTSAQPAPSWLFWDFQAPPSTLIDAYTLDWYGYARGNGDDQPFGDVAVQNSTQFDPTYDDRYRATGHFGRRVLSANPRGATSVTVSASCTPSPTVAVGCHSPQDGAAARFAIYRATFTLEDRDAPAVTSVSGDAVTGDLWAGSAGISVGATDEGGGVYRLGVEVDGEIRSWINVADAPCRAWPGTQRTFLSPKPCPSTVGGLQSISTSDLPEGTHTVRVVVEDAAGNQATAYGPTTKTISRTAVKGGQGPGPGPGPADPGPENGTPAAADAVIRASWEGRESSVRTIRFNQQPVLRGQLTTGAGQPIKDAAIRVTIRRDARNSPSFERESLLTNSEGRFRWKMPKGSSSRKITLSYRRRLRDAQPVTTKDLRLKVGAGLRLALDRRTARQGQAVRLTGTLLGRPVPRGGKVVELQARNPGRRWITFRTVRASKSGRFRATYRFRNPGPARFQMRARARKSGDYPYSTGASPIRSIRVR